MTYITIAVAAAAAIVFAGCDRLDDDRVPLQPVNISFTTVAEWNIYGVSGAMTWKEFIRDLRRPADFPFKATTYTGFGGVLLVSDVLGNPRAYDLSCPVERRRDVRVAVQPSEDYLVRCPECGSTYNVFSLMGHPVGGEAAEKGYALRPYVVSAGFGGEYMLVRN